MTVVGSGRSGVAGLDGPADQGELHTPIDLGFDSRGTLYIAERYYHRVVAVGPDGIMRLAAGKLDGANNAKPGFSGDGGQATEANLNSTGAVAVGPDGHLYIADTGNHRIRRVDPEGIITTVVGTGVRGYSGDGGPAVDAQLDSATGMAFDADGNLFIADTGNFRVRMMDRDGIITTVVGRGESGASPDGTPALEAMLEHPSDHLPNGLAFDRAGRLHICDTGNNRVWMIADGRIQTVAGNGADTTTGDGGPATAASISGPLDIAFGPEDELYIATHTHGQSGHQIRMVDEAGVISTIAGTGAMGNSGDGGPAAAATFNIPSSVAVGPDGNLYIADAINQRIRMVALARS